MGLSKKNLYSVDSLSLNTYNKYLDIDSYIRWWLLNEITVNIEGTRTENNFYMYKDRGYDQKLHAGPVWDFDWGTFWNSHLEEWFWNYNGEPWICKNTKWFEQLFKSNEFKSRVKTYWNNVKKQLSQNIDEFYKTIVLYNEYSVRRDQFLYPLPYEPNNTSANCDSGLSYEEANDLIINVLLNRMDWIDQKINEW